jgi:pimeloyl-ACP methyl ester carboxylesterase
VSGGIRLCYETFGDPADPPLLLIGGMASQMIDWPLDLCHQLVAHGFYVIRFDNRDAGLSTHMEQPPQVMEVLETLSSGEEPEVPYHLWDMAADTAGLLDHLGIERAHAVGMSLGGMVAQELAIRHGDRLASLTSIMSMTGDPDVGQPTPAAVGALLQPPPETREEAMERGVAHSRIWGSEGADHDYVRALNAAKWDRDNDPRGSARQFIAVVTSGSRSEALRSISIPTLAIHGTQDELIQPDGGERLAEVVPGAELLIVEGMGHDLARVFWPTLVEAITTHAAKHPPGIEG